MSLNFGGINIGGNSGGGGGGNYLNVNASNLSATGKTVFDGQWITSKHKFLDMADITNDTSTAVKTNIDLSQTLPDDGQSYEVLLTWWLNSTNPTTSGSVNQITCSFEHNIINTDFSYAYLGRASIYKIADSVFLTVPNLGSQILVVTPERKVRLVVYGNGKGNMADLSQMAYRRIGTNQ